MADPSIVQIKIENLVKLMKKGKVHKAYENMYITAKKLAQQDAFEFQRVKTVNDYMGGKSHKQQKGPLAPVVDYSRYIEKRIIFHLDRMEKLLQLSLDSKK